MASPVRLYLAKNCGLEGVELVKPFPKVGNPNDSALPREYKLTTTGQFRFKRSCESFSYNKMSSSSTLSSKDIPIPTAYHKLHNIHECYESTRSNLTVSGTDSVLDSYQFDSSENNQEFTGWLSPTSDLSLPKAAKKKAGIPAKAKRYSFMHPPSGLVNMLDWNYYTDKLMPLSPSSPQAPVNVMVSDGSKTSSIMSRGSRRDTRPTVQKPDDSALAYFSMLGGFVYFDIENNILQINAISLCKTDSQLHLMGPFSVPKSVCRDMHAMKRSQLLPIDIFHEAGFTANGWVRPKESFRSLSPSIEHPNNFGGFLYFRDNGTAVAYLISPSLNIIPSGGIEALIDVYQTSSIVIHDKEKLRFVDEREFLRFTDVEDFDETLDLIKAKTISDQAKDGLILSRTLVHRACRSGYGKEDIDFLLRSEHGEVDNLSYQDEELQWTPLHYACRFNPQDEELIDFLVDLCRPALLKKDRYHRYPLHIACDSHASESVISILLKEDHDDKALLSSTLKLKRLPLHIALNRGVSFEVIELLLEKSSLGMHNSIRKDTKIGRLPLHIAIEKRLPSNIIKALLEADASVNQFDHNTDSDDIYQRFNGRLPLHIACWNNSNTDTIVLLLKKDKRNITFREPVDSERYEQNSANSYVISPSTSRLVASSLSESLLDHGSRSRPSLNREDTQQSISHNMKSMVALHLSLLADDPTDTVRVLLQKEKEQENAGRDNTVLFLDEHDRSPLHIACKVQAGDDIIKLLLDLDTGRRAVTLKDKSGYTPIHYACDHNNACTAIVQMLLEAKSVSDEYSKEIDSSTHTHAFTKEETYNSLDQELDSPSLDEGRTEGTVTFTPGLRMHPKMRREALIIREPSMRRRPKKSSYSSINPANQQNKAPLCLAVRAGAPVEVVDILLKNCGCNLNGVDEKTSVALSNLIKENGVLQDNIIDELTDRSNFMVLFLELIVNIFAIIVFIIAVENVLNCSNEGGSTSFAVGGIYACICLFLLRELSQIISQLSDYLLDPQNLFENLNIILLIRSVLILNDAERRCLEEEHSQIPEGYYQAIVIICGIMLILNVIQFLSSTFLPFARFAGGLSSIIITLIPFYIGSTLILLLFTFSFRVTNIGGFDEIDEKYSYRCRESFSKCFADVVEGFFAGGKDNLSNSPMEFVFGLFVVIVLLNVLIAIVSEAWAVAGDNASEYYWRSRLAFLSESLLLKEFMGKILGVIFIGKWGQRLDKFTRPRYSDSISWLKDEPYCQVSSKAQYEKPEDHFVRGANEIRAAHSLQADIHWIRDDHHSRHSKNSYEVFAVKKEITQKVLKWILSAAAYILLILLGTVTLGVFWPKDFRKFVLSSGTGGNESKSDDAYTRKKKIAKDSRPCEKPHSDEHDHLPSRKRSSIESSGSADGPRRDSLNTLKRQSVIGVKCLTTK